MGAHEGVHAGRADFTGQPTLDRLRNVASGGYSGRTLNSLRRTSVVWSGIRYTKRRGQLVRVERLAARGGGGSGGGDAAAAMVITPLLAEIYNKAAAARHPWRGAQ